MTIYTYLVIKLEKLSTSKRAIKFVYQISLISTGLILLTILARDDANNDQGFPLQKTLTFMGLWFFILIIGFRIPDAARSGIEPFATHDALLNTDEESIRFTVDNIQIGAKRIVNNLLPQIIMTYVVCLIVISYLLNFLFGSLDFNGAVTSGDDVLSSAIRATFIASPKNFGVILFFWIPQALIFRLIANFEERRKEEFSRSVQYLSKYLLDIFLAEVIAFTALIGINVVFLFLLPSFTASGILFTLVLIGFYGYYTFLIFVRISFVQANIVISGLSVTDAYRKSWEQTTGKWLPLFIVLLISALGVGVLNRVLSIGISAVVNSRGLDALALPEILTAPIVAILVVSAFYLQKIVDEETPDSRIFNIRQSKI